MAKTKKAVVATASAGGEQGAAPADEQQGVTEVASSDQHGQQDQVDRPDQQEQVEQHGAGESDAAVAAGADGSPVEGAGHAEEAPQAVVAPVDSEASAEVVEPQAEAADIAAEEPAGATYPRMLHVQNNSVHTIQCRASGVYAIGGGTHDLTVISEQHERELLAGLAETVAGLGIAPNQLVIVPA